MKRLAIILIGSAVIATLIGCSVPEKLKTPKKIDTSLYDYKPASAAEKDVYNFFVTCEKSVGQQDLNKFLSCFNDGAKIRINQGEGKNPMVTKSAYRNHLKGGAFKRMKSGNLINPSFKVDGEKANIKCFRIQNNKPVMKYDFSLIKEDDKWSIIRSDYKWTK